MKEYSDKICVLSSHLKYEWDGFPLDWRGHLVTLFDDPLVDRVVKAHRLETTALLLFSVHLHHARTQTTFKKIMKVS